MAIFYRGAGINTYWYLNDPHEIIPATCVKNSFDVYPELALSE